MSAIPPDSTHMYEQLDLETRHLQHAIGELAARLHAATYALLVMLRQFDAEAEWNNGFLSCAHWLTPGWEWRTGIDLGAAREKVRVARALATLPLISAAMQRGTVSYAKVRAITRVATPDTEQRLLEVADAAVHLSAETSRRLACDAAVVRMPHDAAGHVLDVDRKTRTIPSAIRPR